MLPALSGFFDTLRARGLRLAPAEALDAVQALAAVGVESRDAVHSALRMTCAKDARAATAFDEEFARYFAAPAHTGGRGEKAGDGGGLAGAGPGGASVGVGRPEPTPPSRRRDDDAHRPARTSPARPSGTPVAARGRAREMPATPLAGELRDLSRARTARLRRVLLEPRGVAPAAAGSQPRAQPGGAPVSEAERKRAGAAERAARDEAARSGGRQADEALRQVDLRAPVPLAVDRRLADEAVGMIAELRLRLGRRLEPGRRGRLALRRTLRRSLATAGVPFRLERSTRRRKRARVVLLLDVSRSVERAAGLFLILATSFLEEIVRTRVYAFVDRAIECTRPLTVWARGGHAAGAASGAAGVPGATFADALRGVAGISLDAPSDYGRTFYGLGGEPRIGGRDVVLVVLGDGRTNRFERLDWAFEDLARRARAVVWLVPERAATWGTGDSALAAYLPHADVAVEAADLAGLARGLEAVLRRVAA